MCYYSKILFATLFKLNLALFYSQVRVQDFAVFFITMIGILKFYYC